MARDLNEMAGGLSPAEQASLDASLLNKFGSGLRAAARKEQTDVKRILKRGAIDNDDDFRLIRGQVDDADKAVRFSSSEIELIQKLLFAYESAKW